MAWIDNFKYQHTYWIKAGWKVWDDDTVTEYTDGNDGGSYKLRVDCGDYGCVGSGAKTLVASAVALAALLSF